MNANETIDSTNALSAQNEVVLETETEKLYTAKAECQNVDTQECANGICVVTWKPNKVAA